MTNAPYLAGSNAAASGGSTTLNVPITVTTGNNDSIIVGVLITISGVTVTVGPDSQGNVYPDHDQQQSAHRADSHL
jgi:hypothetical protein